MLLRFRVANHRSIRDEQELSLIGTEFNEGTARPTPLTSGGTPVAVLPVVGIFGANASGKSNTLAALSFMREAVRGSFADWVKSPGTVPREPFALDPACRDETTLFEVDLLLRAEPTSPPVRYTYGFELSDERVAAEWLHAYPRGKRNVWFDRDAARAAAAGGEFVFRGTGFKGRRDDLVRLTRPNALFLSVGASLNDPQLSVIHHWFARSLTSMPSGNDVLARTQRTRNSLSHARDEAGHGQYLSRISALLAIADLGIVGLDVDPETSEVRLLHRRASAQDVPMDAAPVAFRPGVPLEFLSEESAGTHAWFALLGPMLDVLENGSTLVVDELDSSLHPTLAAEVVRLFQSLESNPHGGQLIFTTHDATLLGKAALDRPLDRDQVWIAKKRRSGETELYPLIDAKPRKEENLEHGYLRGRYGGIPRTTAGELARTMSQATA